MVKPRNYLKGRFETGDIPIGEDYENWLDSFWHKSELGTVTNGNTMPVTGGAVYSALASLNGEIEGKLQDMITEALAGILEDALAGYATQRDLESALSDNATKTWVQEKLDEKATTDSVEAVETVVGAAGVQVSVTKDLDETRKKVNDLIDKLTDGGAISDVEPLVVNG